MAAAVGAACGLMASASVARADYTVYACKAPTGLPAALSGWEPVTGGDAAASNECATGGVLALAMTGPGPWTGGQGAEHRFTAPPGTSVSRVHLQRRTSGLAGNPERWAYTLYAGATELETCEAGGASKCTADLSGPADFPNLAAATVGLRAGCAQIQTSSCAAPAVRVEVPQLALTLKDVTPPTVTNVTGSLATAGPAVKGVLTATYDASDVGGGYYRTIVEVDGVVVSVEASDTPGCVDADTSNADPFEFVAAAPCPATQRGVAAGLDTTRLADGPHTITVLAEDAAGNRSTVIGARPLTVANQPVAGSAGSARPNGINADPKGRLRVWFDRNRKQSLTSRYGKRVVLRGRLVSSRGRSIQGARIDVYHRRGKRGKLVQLTKTGLKTRKNGRLTLILPLDLTTRNIVLAYRSTRPGPITSRQTLKLRVVDANGNTVTRRRGKLGRVG